MARWFSLLAYGSFISLLDRGSQLSMLRADPGPRRERLASPRYRRRKNSLALAPDGTHVWFAAGEALPARSIRRVAGPCAPSTSHPTPARRSTGATSISSPTIAFKKSTPARGAIVATLPAPGKSHDLGLT